MEGKLKLGELLDTEWEKVLKPIILEREEKDLKRFLSPEREWTIPKRENTFAALRGIPPSQWKVLIIGQDPYPREESAVGIAFNDGAIKKASFFSF